MPTQEAIMLYLVYGRTLSSVNSSLCSAGVPGFLWINSIWSHWLKSFQNPVLRCIIHVFCFFTIVEGIKVYTGKTGKAAQLTFNMAFSSFLAFFFSPAVSASRPLFLFFPHSGSLSITVFISLSTNSPYDAKENVSIEFGQPGIGFPQGCHSMSGPLFIYDDSIYK